MAFFSGAHQLLAQTLCGVRLSNTTKGVCSLERSAMCSVGRIGLRADLVRSSCSVFGSLCGSSRRRRRRNRPQAAVALPASGAGSGSGTGTGAGAVAAAAVVAVAVAGAVAVTVAVADAVAVAVSIVDAPSLGNAKDGPILS